MMAREEYIRIYRSNIPGAAPSLTSGEIAANLVDGKLFVGATNSDGSLRNVVFNDVRASVTGIAAGHGLSASGSTGTITLFNMGVTGANVGYGLVSLTGSQTGTVSFAVAGLTTTSSLDSLSVQGNDLYLSLGQHINLIRHSQDFVSGASDWSTYNGIAAPTNIGTDNTKGWPGGATGGISITFQSNSNNGIYQVWPTGSLEKNTSYTVSCWARSNTGTEKCRWSYYDDQPGGQISYFSDDFNLTTTPQRVAFTFTTLSNNTVSNVAFGNGSGSAAGVVLAWGFQLERGRFATDPIRTFGATGASTPRILQVNSGVTGVVAGHGLSASGSTGTITLYNMGVTSFNGLTGTVNYYPPFATDSVTGVAAFNNKEFGIVSGVVSSRGVTGISAGNTGIAIDGPTGEVVISNMGVLSFNGSTGHVSVSIGQTVTGDGGALVGANNSLITARLSTESLTGVASFPPTFFSVANGAVSLSGGISFRDSYNTTDTVNYNETLTLTGFGPNSIRVEQAGNNTFRFANLGVTSFNGQAGAVNYYPPFATESVTGVASFNNTDFGVVTGIVSLKNAVKNIAVGASSFTGTVSITNGSNVTISTANNRITISSSVGATGNTLVSGIAAGVSAVAGNTIAINNLGVTSFNGATGTINYYPPIANSSGTGVAYFRPGDFNVSLTGAVTLDSAVVKGSTGNTVVSGIAAGVSSVGGNTVAINNLGVTGIAVAANHGLAASGITGTITLRNMGVTGVSANTNSGITISGTTGHVVFALANTGFSLRDDSQQSSTVSLGDTLTITGGTGVVFRKTSEDNYAIYSNFTINGAPPNGNDFTVQTDGKLSIPFATESVTGVASFPLEDFGVSTTGQVSLTGNVARRNTTNTFTSLQTFQGGITGTTANFRFGDIDFVYSEEISLSGNAPGLFWLGGNNRAYPSFIGFPQSGDDRIHIVGGGVVVIGNPSSLGPEYPGNDGGIVINDGTLSFEDFTTINGAVRTINGFDNNVTLTGDGGAIRGIGLTFSARPATSSLTGVASFPPTFFSVADGAVSLSGGISFRDSFNTTDVVNYNETFTLTGFGSNGIRVESAGNNTFRFTNLGVTSFNGQAGVVTYYPPIASVGATGLAAFRESNFDVSGTGAVSIKSGGVPNTALANSSVTVSAGTGLGGGGSVSLGNTVTLTNRGVTSFNGLTGAVTLTGDGGAVRGVNNNAITARIVDCNGASGVVAFDCSIFTINNGVVTGVKTINPGAACESCAATAANSTECDDCQGLGCNCTWFAVPGGGGSCVCNPIAFEGNGFASEYDVNGNLAALYLDINNLNSYTGEFTTKTTPKVVMFDPDEIGSLKTKTVTIQDLFVKNFNIFESKTPGQLLSPNKKGTNDKIEFEIVTGLLAQGDQGLLKGGTAYEYIANNTISSINGCTGGTFSITGTAQEVTVTTGINCRQIVIGLPDSVRIPHISGTGGTFSGTITANKFVGSMDGGLF